MTQLGPGSILPNYQRLRVLKWRDMTTDDSSYNNQYRQRGQKGFPVGMTRLSLAQMTDPRRDLVNLSAVKPQVNHHRTQHISPLKSIIKKSKSINDISNIYASQYQKNKPEQKNVSTPYNASHSQDLQKESSASKKQLHARSQNAFTNGSDNSVVTDSQAQGTNNPVPTSEKGRSQRGKGDTAQIGRDAAPSGQNPNQAQSQNFYR